MIESRTLAPISAATPKITSSAPAMTMPRTLISLSSWPSFNSRPPVWGTKLSMFRFQHLHKVGIVDRHQRALLQAVQEEEEPDAADSNRANDVHGRVRPVKIFESRALVPLVKIRRSQPEEVHQAHEHQEQGNPHHARRIAFEVAREQQRERKDKVHKDKRGAKPLPAAIKAYQIPADLREHVARPDAQPLRQGKLGPQHYEGGHQLAEVMQVVNLEHPRDGLHSRQPHQQHDDETERADNLAYHKQHAP